MKEMKKTPTRRKKRKTKKRQKKMMKRKTRMRMRKLFWYQVRIQCACVRTGEGTNVGMEFVMDVT